MSDESVSFMPRDEDYDPDAPLRPRKPQRAGIPRAAKESDIESRLYAIQRRAAMEFQGRDAV